MKKSGLILLLVLLGGCSLHQNGSVVSETDPIRKIRASKSVTKVYDETFVSKIQSHWFDLLDQIKNQDYQKGYVTMQFRLHSDSQLTDLKISRSTVGERLTIL